jgi:dihydroxyacetone kinase phosphotransfer subunit
VSGTVGLVVVSHSRVLGDAAVALAREMAPAELAIEVAAGLDETTFGTDAVAIATAIGAADSGAGVVVLMDLGSAVLSAELALDLLDDPDARDRVLLCPAPLVEGLVVAAVTAAGGADRAEVAAEAAGALAGKQAQLGGPAPSGTTAGETPAAEVTAEFEGIADAVKDRIDAVELTDALDEIWRRIKRLNRYVQEQEPWQLAKDESAGDRLDEVLYTLAEGLRVVSVLLHAFMPPSAERLLAALGREDRELEGAVLGAVEGGAKLGELGQLFPRVEAEAPAA